MSTDTSQTVTVKRNAGGGNTIDLTVVLVDGSIHTVLDEYGNAVTLNENERIKAICLFNAGVDETGR